MYRRVINLVNILPLFLIFVVNSVECDDIIGFGPVILTRRNCSAEPSAPVCAYAHHRADQIQFTFANQCELDEHNRKFGDGYRKLKDGPCTCQTCDRNYKPVCMVADGNNKKELGFLNQCFADRYRCLHGIWSVTFTYRDGLCQICVPETPKRNFYNADDPYEETLRKFIKWNRSWQSDYGLVCTDDTTTPLIAD